MEHWQNWYGEDNHHAVSSNLDRSIRINLTDAIIQEMVIFIDLGNEINSGRKIHGDHQKNTK